MNWRTVHQDVMADTAPLAEEKAETETLESMVIWEASTTSSSNSKCAICILRKCLPARQCSRFEFSFLSTHITV